MADNKQEFDDLHASLLQTNAKLFSIESLCLSLFKHHPDKQAVVAQFLDMKERYAATALNDDELLDPVPAEIDDAHEHVHSALRNLSD